MSAYVLTDFEINLLVHLAVHGPREAEGWRSLTDQPAGIGAQLAARNAEAAGHPEDGPRDYAFAPLNLDVSAVEGLKQIDHYVYQTADFEGRWRAGEEGQFLDTLRVALIAALPGWAEAPWSWSRQDVLSHVADPKEGDQPIDSRVQDLLDHFERADAVVEPLAGAMEDTRTAVVQRSTLVQEPLGPQPGPVPLLTNWDTWLPVYAWVPGASQFQPLPGLDGTTVEASTTLNAGGTAALFTRATFHDPHDESVPLTHRKRNLGVYRLTFATGVIDRVDFEPRLGWLNGLHSAGSSERLGVAILETWFDTPPERKATKDDARLTLSLSGVTGAPPRELLTLPGSTPQAADALVVEWSPDATKIAFGMISADVPPGTSPYVLIIVDAVSGREVSRIGGMTIAGSASWSPDGTRLLVRDMKSIVWIHDLSTDQNHPIPYLPGPRPDSAKKGVPRLLGFADNHRIMVAVQRGRTMTVSSADPDTGEGHALIRWTGGDYMYPVLASMPPGYWD
jgi:hypothetical protein